MVEYVDFAVRLSVLEEFYTLAPTCVLQHKFCDLAFCNWLAKRSPEPTRFSPEDDQNFMYFYSNAPNPRIEVGGQTSTNSVPVFQSDRKIAKQELKAAQSSMGDQYDIGLGQLIYFIATLRQVLEEELVQIRILSEYTPPRAQTDEICSRKVLH